MRVLLVEDDPSIRDLLEKFLGADARCDLAADGKAGVAAFEHSLETGAHYDLICLDLVMPMLDGWDALRLIREREEARGIAPEHGVRVLVLTARDSSQNLRRYLGTPPPREGFLLKPFRRSDLMAAIRGLGIEIPSA